MKKEILEALAKVIEALGKLRFSITCCYKSSCNEKISDKKNISNIDITYV